MELLTAWRICSVNWTVLQNALDSPFRDYEDAVQHAAAVLHQLDVIITRNLEDYKGAVIPELSPPDFLNQIPAS